MTPEPVEVPLTGGRVSAGIVRVGDTVRRPLAGNSGLVRPLLRYLRDHGFGAAPAFLGVDEQGREILSYLEGEVPAQLAFHDDASLTAAARLIRVFHDLGAAFVEAAAIRAEVVCHNDLSPCNFVFRAGRPVGIIDFDAAAPGRRVDDLGYAAWLWLDIGSPDIAAAEQGRRLGILLEAYGPVDRGAVIEAMQGRQAALASSARSAGALDMATWAATCLDWTRTNAPGLVGA